MDGKRDKRWDANTVQEKKGEGRVGEVERKKEGDGEWAEGEKGGGEEGDGEGDVRILSSWEGWLMSWMVPLASS